MGIIRDLYVARKISAGAKLPAPTVALLIKRLALAAAMGGGGGTETTVTGTLPLTLANALSHAIVSLTRYGLCTQDGTPTPDAPVDIMCNNGALKWDSVNQRVYADGTPEVLTVGGPNLLNTATNITGKYITAGGKISNGADAQYTDLIPVTAGETYIWSLVSNRENGGSDRCHGYNSSGNWVRQIAWQTTGKGVGLPFFLLATIPNGISYVRLSYGINDTEVMLSSSWSVAENVAEGFFNGVYPNNICCLPSNYESETIQSPYTSALASRAPALLAKVEPGKKYYIRNTVNGEVRRSITYFASLDDVTDSNKSIYHIDAASNDIAYTAAPTGAAYVVIGFKSAAADTTYTFGAPDVVEINAADYQPYVAPQTASVPSLFALDNRKDEADIISGAVTRQTGIKVLDGTENWVGNPDLNYFVVYGYLDSYTPTPTKAPQNMMPLSTHFSRKSGGITPRLHAAGTDLFFYYSEEFSDLATWKAWLAAQYAAGTPVIIVYKLNGTEVTEQVPAQRLRTVAGDNVVSVTANVGPLTAEVKYMAASAQNILSTLLGMKATPKDISTQDAEEHD